MSEDERCQQCSAAVDEACDGLNLNQCPRHRTGSFPLMNLAADYGVDYADVLLWAGSVRELCVSAPFNGRIREANAAYDRMEAAAGPRFGELMMALHAHSFERWGRA